MVHSSSHDIKLYPVTVMAKFPSKFTTLARPLSRSTRKSRRDSSPDCKRPLPSTEGPSTSSTTLSEGQELLQEALHVTKERDLLRSEVTILRSALEDCNLQLVEYDRLVTEAHAFLLDSRTQSSSDKRSKRASFSLLNRSRSIGNWLMNSWSSGTSANGFLNNVETSVREGKWQEALTTLSCLLAGKDIIKSNKVNARLLLAAIQRHCNKPIEALKDAETALADGTSSQLYTLAGKAQFFRGLCLFDLGKFPDAAWCFALASHIPEYKERAEMERTHSLARMRALPKEGLERVLSSHFSLLPRSPGQG
jgi:hypothetical protein